VSTIANEMEGSFLNHILVDALNTALAAQIIRLCGDPTANSLEPSNGLSRQPLTLIAQAVGFSDQSHLTSVFRREIGITPGHFRNALG
jgi:AraC-like DNA-binding protein